MHSRANAGRPGASARNAGATVPTIAPAPNSIRLSPILSARRPAGRALSSDPASVPPKRMAVTRSTSPAARTSRTRKPRKGETHVEFVSEQVVADVVANAAKAGRPVYFAVTLRNIISELYLDRMVREGLVSRVTEEKPAAPVDYDRLTENLTKNYRLRWPKRLPPWPQNMSPLTRQVAPLAVNYANLYVLLAQRDDSLGRREEAAAAWHQAVDWMVRGERKDAADAFVDEWLKRSPNEPVAKQLKAKLERIRGPQVIPGSR